MSYIIIKVDLDLLDYRYEYKLIGWCEKKVVANRWVRELSKKDKKYRDEWISDSPTYPCCYIIKSLKKLEDKWTKS